MLRASVAADLWKSDRIWYSYAASRSGHMQPLAIWIELFFRALEPKISGQIMELHHSKHHATYVAGMNTAAKELQQVGWSNFACHEVLCAWSGTPLYRCKFALAPSALQHASLEQAEGAGDVKKIITLEKAINFNGGGNHSIWWSCYCSIVTYLWTWLFSVTYGKAIAKYDSKHFSNLNRSWAASKSIFWHVVSSFLQQQGR